MNELQVVRALSVPRMSTYQASVSGADLSSALALYGWNAQVSAALLLPLHVCEVVLRNAIADALEAVYGAQWPWSPGFEQSLPNPVSGFNPRRELQRSRDGQPAAGKVIAELKFAFWQCLLTKRHDQRIWRAHLVRVLPNLDQSLTLAEQRKDLHDALESIRGLRNRIAHHEPIFMRQLAQEFIIITGLIEKRCLHTAVWMQAHEQVRQLIGARP